MNHPLAKESAASALEPNVPSESEIHRATGLRLHSVFQSIFSVSHSKVVGHEALLRGQDPLGKAVGPGEIFPRLAAHFGPDAINELCARLHLAQFAAQARDGWLFLNVNPDTVPSRHLVTERFGRWLQAESIPAHRVVVEIVETRSVDERRLADAVHGYRDLGCLVAIDDFGAGESNFERVWRLRPDVVKLDRAMLEEAVSNPLVRHILPGIVSLVHEAGCLVVLEGIETEEQALLAMESDVDFVQGYHFSRPALVAPEPERARETFGALDRELKRALTERSREDRGFLESYSAGFAHCALSIERSVPLGEAAREFLKMSGVQRMYVLDHEGRQVSENVEARDSQRPPDPRFDPCSDGTGANWFRRPYFQRAIQTPRTLQVSRPYLSIRDARTCVTLSIAFDGPDGRLRVLCADLDYDPSEPFSRRDPLHSSIIPRPS